MNDFLEIIRFVGNASWKVLPFFLLSMFLSVMVNMLDLTDAIRGAFAGREGLAVLLATAVGAFSPFCSCTVIPIIAGLLTSGIPLAPVMSFWIASPTMDPEIFTLTVGILGWPLAVSGCRLSDPAALPVRVFPSNPSHRSRKIITTEDVALLQDSKGSTPCTGHSDGSACCLLFGG